MLFSQCLHPGRFAAVWFPCALTHSSPPCNVCQCGVHPMLISSWEHPAILTILLPCSLVRLSAWHRLFLYHLSDIVIMHPQIRTVVPIWSNCSLSVDSSGTTDFDSPDGACIRQSSVGLPRSRCDVAGLDMYAWFWACHRYLCGFVLSLLRSCFPAVRKRAWGS